MALPCRPDYPVLRGAGRRLLRPAVRRLILIAIVVVVAWTEAASFVVPRRPRASDVETTPAAVQISIAAPRPRIEAKPLAYTAPQSLDRAPNRTGGGRTALIVGIDAAPGAPPLRGSKTDAFTMRTALTGYGFRPDEITMLLDADATRGRVLQALDDLAARSSEDGIAVVAITTHSSVGRNGYSFRLWDGRIGARLLARELGAVRGRLWTMLVMCYAGGYALPGVVGADRLAIFSSSAAEKSWQLGSAGSFAMNYVVASAMIERRAPSVEAAFHDAHRRMVDDGRRTLPLMSDGVTGDLVLGPLATTGGDDDPSPPEPTAAAEVALTPPPTTPAPTPEPTPGVSAADVLLPPSPPVVLPRASPPLDL